MATVAIITFVMSIGIIFKITDLLARGVSWKPMLNIFLYSMPAALAFAIPVSVLVASLLVFGQLSSDSEITAMKACGLSHWQIISRPLLISTALTALCLYINNEIAPASHFARRSATARLAMESPMDILEEGRFIHDFNNLTIYVEKKQGKQLSNIRICDTTEKGFRRHIHAKTGTIGVSSNNTDMEIRLSDVRIDPFAQDRPGAGFCKHLTMTIPNALNRNEYRKSRKDLTMAELWHGIGNVSSSFPNVYGEEALRLRMVLLVELNKRLSLSFACIAFVLLGSALGIKSHRKESSIGILISLVLMFVFYIFIIVAESMATNFRIRPDLIVLMPVFLFGILGFFLIRRVN